VQIGKDPTKIDYTKANSTTLNLASGLKRDAPSGTIVKVVPCFGCGGQIIEVTGEGGGCSMRDPNGVGAGLVVYCLAFVVWIWRRNLPARDRAA